MRNYRNQRKIHSILAQIILITFLITIPSYFQIDNDFKPVKMDIDLKKNAWRGLSFNLKRQEPLQFELDYNVEGKEDINETLAVIVNNNKIQEIPIDNPKSGQRVKFLVSESNFLKGENRLSFRLISPNISRVTFDNLKVCNYVGISPNIPVAYSIPDEGTQNFALFGNLGSNILYFFSLFFIIFSLIILYLTILSLLFYSDLWLCCRKCYKLFILSALCPWISLMYSFITPYKIIFPHETVLWITILFPLLIIAVGVLLIGSFYPVMVNILLPNSKRGSDFFILLRKRIINFINRQIEKIPVPEIEFSPQKYMLIKRIIMFSGIVYLIWAAWHGLSRTGNTQYISEVTPYYYTPPLGGDAKIEYEFAAEVDTIGKIYLFPVNQDMERALHEDMHINLISINKGTTLFEIKEKIERWETWSAGSLYWEIEPVKLILGEWYRLEISMPHTPQGQGMRLIYSNRFMDHECRLLIDNIEQHGKNLNFLFLADKPDIPILPLLIGLAIIALSLVLMNNRVGYAVLPACLGVVFLLSQFCWETRVWNFFGTYSPDGYIMMAHQFRLWLTGPLSFSALSSFLSTNITGQSWVIPLLIAILKFFDISYHFGYIFLNICFTAGSVLLLAGTAKRFHAFQKPDAFTLLIIAISFHLIFIRGAFSMLTDAGGMFFTTLFAISYIKMFMYEKKKFSHSILPALAIFFGIQTRIALLPILFVPFATALWFLFFKKERNLKLLGYVMLPCVIGAMLIGVSFTSLNLWDTILLAKKRSAIPEFKALFNLADFWECTIVGFQLAIIAIPFSIKRVIKDEIYFIVVCIFAGFEAMMLIGKIIPWYRYWATVAPLAAFFGCLIFAEQITGKKQYALLIFATVLANIGFTLFNPTF